MDYRSERFEKGMSSFAHSWRWFRPEVSGFLPEWQGSGRLKRDGEFPCIWGTRHKYVLKVTGTSGVVFAFKTHSRMKVLPYCLHASPYLREACNYQTLIDLGLPMARLLAAGEIRHCFCIRTGFLATEFAEGTLDGRAFYPGGAFAERKELRDAFLRQNLLGAARIHDAGIVHGGFHPYNFLWKEESNSLRVIWIDVATCRKTHFGIAKGILNDLKQFFVPFQLSGEELQDYVEFYCQATHRKRVTAASLLQAIGE